MHNCRGSRLVASHLLCAVWQGFLRKQDTTALFKKCGGAPGGGGRRRCNAGPGSRHVCHRRWIERRVDHVVVCRGHRCQGVLGLRLGRGGALKTRCGDAIVGDVYLGNGGGGSPTPARVYQAQARAHPRRCGVVCVRAGTARWSPT
jgi:hypothetical protein